MKVNSARQSFFRPPSRMAFRRLGYSIPKWGRSSICEAQVAAHRDRKALQPRQPTPGQPLMRLGGEHFAGIAFDNRQKPIAAALRAVDQEQPFQLRQPVVAYRRSTALRSRPAPRQAALGAAVKQRAGQQQFAGAGAPAAAPVRPGR